MKIALYLGMIVWLSLGFDKKSHESNWDMAATKSGSYPLLAFQPESLESNSFRPDRP